jgi:hypothetical protein
VSDRSNLVDKPDGDSMRIIFFECQRNPYFRSRLQNSPTNSATEMLLGRADILPSQCFFLVEISAQQNIVRHFIACFFVSMISSRFSRYDSLRHCNSLYSI